MKTDRTIRLDRKKADMRTLVLGAAIAVLVALPCTSFAQGDEKKPAPADPTPVEAVLAKFAAASGGPALKKIKSRSVEGTFEVVGQGISGKSKVVQRGTDMVTEMDTPFGKETHGVLGKVAWEMSSRGDRLKTPIEFEQIMRSLHLDMPLRFKSLYAKITHEGVVEFKGKKCAKLICTPPSIKLKDGTTKVVPDEVYFFGEESGLVHGMEMETESQMGKLKVLTTAADYRDVDGVMISFLSTQEVAAFGMTVKLITTKVEQNIELPETAFALPASIVKLIERDKEAADKKKDTPEKKAG